MGWALRGYARTLDRGAAGIRLLTLLVMLATVAATVNLYVKTPKGYFPQDDTGLIFGSTRASPDISFDAMVKLQQRALEIVLADPAVRGRRLLGRRLGLERVGQPGADVHQPEAAVGTRRAHHPAHHRPAAPRARRHRGPQRVVLRRPGHSRRRAPGPVAVPVHLLEPRFRRPLRTGCPRWWNASRQVPGLTDVSTDREQGGLQADHLDRPAGGGAARREACRTSTARSTTPSRSARSPPSTPSATSTASSWRSIRASSATPPTSPASSCRAGTACRCRSTA